MKRGSGVRFLKQKRISWNHTFWIASKASFINCHTLFLKQNEKAFFVFDGNKSLTIHTLLLYAHHTDVSGFMPA